MPNLAVPDPDLNHLYPPFRLLVQLALAQATTESRGKHPAFVRWGVFEGYRSVARQQWLYAQGRTRPGSIVTNLQKPKRHGLGLAADIVWYDSAGNPHWDGPDALWQTLGHAIRTQKAAGQKCVWGGDWATFRDAPHMETGLIAYAAWCLPARAWLKSIGMMTPA